VERRAMPMPKKAEREKVTAIKIRFNGQTGS